MKNLKHIFAIGAITIAVITGAHYGIDAGLSVFVAYVLGNIEEMVTRN